MSTRTFALVFGIMYTLIGILGFIPGITQMPPAGALPLRFDAGYGYLMGLFPINALHNIVHLVIGLMGIIAYRSFSGAHAYARGLAISLGMLAIMGLIPGFDTSFGFIPLFSHDIWLHALSAVVAAYFGFMASQSAAVVDASRTQGDISNR